MIIGANSKLKAEIHHIGSTKSMGLEVKIFSCIYIYIYFYHNEAMHQSTVLYDNYNTTV